MFGARAVAFAALMSLILLAVGCGGDDDSSTGAGDDAPTSAASDASTTSGDGIEGDGGPGDGSAGDGGAGDGPVESPLEPAAGTASEPTGGPDWPAHGHDPGSQRAGVDVAIPVDAAPRLEVAWQVDGLKAVTGTPAVVDGVLYVGDWTGHVRALDAETGDERWATEIGGQIAGSPAVTDDGVYVAVDKTTYRLDRATGEVDWEVLVNEHEWTRLYAGPIVVDGVVVQPVAGVQIAVPQEDYTFRGNVVGLDEATGEELWRVYVTEDDETSGAGVSVWAGASADPERELVFVGTGNTYEEPTSPYSDSIVAIDYTTGEIAWSTQFTNPDVYNMPQANGADGPDADVGSTPTLWSVGDRDLVGAGDKAGRFHALDRETGEILWQTQLTPGSRLGGVIGGSAYADGRVFVASNVGDAEAGIPTSESTLFALDAGTGEVLWEGAMELSVFGPASVADGVVYQGTALPAMYAFDAETGEKLFEHTPPAQIGGGPSVVGDTVYWGFGYWVISPPEEPQGGVLALRPAS